MLHRSEEKLKGASNKTGVSNRLLSDISLCIALNDQTNCFSLL
jgi:hypothetical protein